MDLTEEKDDAKLITTRRSSSSSPSGTHQIRRKYGQLHCEKLNAVREEDAEDEVEEKNTACSSHVSELRLSSRTSQHRNPAPSRKRKLFAIQEEEEDGVEQGSKPKSRKEDSSMPLHMLYSDDCGESSKVQEKRRSKFEFWKKKEQGEGNKAFDFSRRHDITITMANSLDSFSFDQKVRDSSSSLTGSQGTSSRSSIEDFVHKTPLTSGSEKKSILQSNTCVNLPSDQKPSATESSGIPNESEEKVTCLSDSSTNILL